MEKVIHGHDLIDLIKEREYSDLVELKATIVEKYGDVKFTNCTQKIYTFEEIVDFLQSRGKIDISGPIKFVPNKCSCSN